MFDTNNVSIIMVLDFTFLLLLILSNLLTFPLIGEI